MSVARAPRETETSSAHGSLRRDVGRTGLTFTSVGSVIGSGWLLGALTATQIAGPAAIISWVIGAAAGCGRGSPGCSRSAG